jgi:hypothetical protein
VKCFIISSSFFGVAIALVAACDSSPPPSTTPPTICKTPPAAGFPWFRDVTADYGLSSGKASSVIAADLDGDGWADLVTTAGSAARTNGTRFVFMNRPKATGGRTFVDATADSGLLATQDGAGGRGWNLTNAGDLDGNGSVDLILCSADEISSTYAPQDACDAFLNDGTGHFTLVPTSDLGSKVHWYPSAALLDYDQDGVLDFWPATVAHWPYDPNGPNREPPTLLRGNGDGTFTNVSASVGLPTKDGTLPLGTQWRHVFGVVACDIDGDGDDDVVFADYGREENQVWRNDNGMFTNVAHDLGVDHDDRADYSDDQSYLCYCETYPTDSTCKPNLPLPIVDCCTFAIQQGCACPGTCAPTFRGWQPGNTDQPFSLGGNYFSFACGDMNNDGLMDLMSATIQHGDVGSDEDPSELMLNPGGGGKFTRPGNTTNGLDRPEPPSRGLYWNHGDDNMVMVDFDLDGLKDIFSTVTGAYEVSDTHHLWRQKSLGKFEEITYPAGLLANGDLPNLQGPAWVDIDGDGDLDLVAGDVRSGGIHVYENLVGQNQNFTRIRLVGGGPGAANRSAIGAVVKVTAGGVTQTQYVSGGYGHGNVEADLVLTFGLGSSCDKPHVEVHWPDAAHSVSQFDVIANQNVTLKQGSTEVAYAK